MRLNHNKSLVYGLIKASCKHLQDAFFILLHGIVEAFSYIAYSQVSD